MGEFMPVEYDQERTRLAPGPELARSHGLLMVVELGELYGDFGRKDLPADLGALSLQLGSAENRFSRRG